MAQAVWSRGNDDIGGAFGLQQMSKLMPGDQCQCGVEVALDAGVEGRHEPDPIDGQTLGGSDTRNQLRLQSTRSPP